MKEIMKTDKEVLKEMFNKAGVVLLENMVILSKAVPGIRTEPGHNGCYSVFFFNPDESLSCLQAFKTENSA